MLIDIAQTLIQSPIDPTHLTIHLTELNLGSIPSMDFLQSLPHYDSNIFAQINQQIPETNIGGDVSQVWQKFVKTGQVWAFLVGVILGYMIKTFTSFG